MNRSNRKKGKLTPQQKYKRTDKGRQRQREANQKYLERNKISNWQVTFTLEQETILEKYRPQNMSKSSFLRELVVPAYLESINYPDKFVVEF